MLDRISPAGLFHEIDGKKTNLEGRRFFPFSFLCRWAKNASTLPCCTSRHSFHSCDRRRCVCERWIRFSLFFLIAFDPRQWSTPCFILRKLHPSFREIRLRFHLKPLDCGRTFRSEQESEKMLKRNSVPSPPPFWFLLFKQKNCFFRSDTLFFYFTSRWKHSGTDSEACSSDNISLARSLVEASSGARFARHSPNNEKMI